jgi:photosystem II stability/assembly factor-like uncharacterized protein
VTWDVRQIASQSLNGVACSGNLLGWAAGSAGFVSHTEDGGQTWSTQQSNLTADLNAIHFGNHFLGLVAGDAGALAYTTDGGAKWSAVSPLTTASLRGAAVAGDVGTLFAAGDKGTLLRSPDSGATWSTIAVAVAADFRGIASDDLARLVLAVDTNGAIWASHDHGLSFTRELLAPAGLDSVSMDDGDEHALVAGKGGLALHRDIEGAWTTLATGTTADLHAALVSYDDGHFYLAGDLGTLVVSTDKGQTWAVKPVATTASLLGLDEL